MTNFLSGALWPIVSLRFAAIAATSLLLQRFFYKAAHFAGWVLTSPRNVEGDVILSYSWVEAVMSGRTPYVDFSSLTRPSP